MRVHLIVLLISIALISDSMAQKGKGGKKGSSKGGKKNDKGDKGDKGDKSGKGGKKTTVMEVASTTGAQTTATMTGTPTGAQTTATMTGTPTAPQTTATPTGAPTTATGAQTTATMTGTPVTTANPMGDMPGSDMCKQGFMYDNDTCIHFSTDQVNYDTAILNCANMNAELIAPKDSLNMNYHFVADCLKKKNVGSFWIGRDEGDTECFDIELKNDKYLWQISQSCTDMKPYICSYPVMCEAGWDYVNGNCVKIMDSKMTFAQAHLECELYGAQLACPKDDETNTKLSDLFSSLSVKEAWIGGVKNRYAYRWVSDGMAIQHSSTFWHAGYPMGKKCIKFYYDMTALKFGWMDFDCDNMSYPICQKPPLMKTMKKM